MLVDRDKFRFAYEELKADGRLCPVHVYVSTADVDSCCAFRILKSMMCSDGIPFSAYPVSGYQELQNLGDTLVSGTLVAQVALGTGNATLVEPFEVAEGQKVFVEIHAPSAVEGVPTLGVVLDDGAPF